MAKNDNAAVAPAVSAGGLKFDVKRRIVVPTMKVELNKAIFIRFEQAIEARKKMEDEKQADGSMKPVEKTIEIARVTNLETGEIVEFVAGTVLMSELSQAYPEWAYVNKSFRILKKDVPGKRYKDYELDEIEVSGK